MRAQALTIQGTSKNSDIYKTTMKNKTTMIKITLFPASQTFFKLYDKTQTEHTISYLQADNKAIEF